MIIIFLTHIYIILCVVWYFHKQLSADNKLKNLSLKNIQAKKTGINFMIFIFKFVEN